MTDDDGYALHSWVDESMHVDGDNGLYIWRLWCAPRIVRPDQGRPAGDA